MTPLEINSLSLFSSRIRPSKDFRILGFLWFKGGSILGFLGFDKNFPPLNENDGYK